ncbi:MAG: transcription antitermination factor NusB [Elusimicrobia bacterium]|nr:transcription antitermination factor NusB [Elusimicrobiota bacterium]
MGVRRDARKLAVRALYTAELLSLPLKDVWEMLTGGEVSGTSGEFAWSLCSGVHENLKFIDELVEELTLNWETERIAAVDRAIIRMGLYEIFFEDSIPRSVSINEAVELAKYFSTGKSHKFVNGILDSASRKKSNEKK